MRKLHISIALALLLLFAQHGAVLHEISHISQVSRADARLHFHEAPAAFLAHFVGNGVGQRVGGRALDALLRRAASRSASPQAKSPVS